VSLKCVAGDRKLLYFYYGNRIYALRPKKPGFYRICWLERVFSLKTRFLTHRW